MSLPHTLSNGPGNIPDAEQLMDNFNACVQKGDQFIPNLLDNGGFEIWQRGTSFTNPALYDYTADRWQAIVSPGSFTFTREATNVDSESYSLKLDVTAAASNRYFYVLQYIENFKFFNGKTLTVTARVKCNASGAVRVALEGDGSSLAYSNYHTGGNTWETLTVTATVASATTLSVLVGMINNVSNDGQVSTTYIDSVMLVVGDQPVVYVPTHPATDLNRCQRYYQRVGGNSAYELIATGQASSAGAAYGIIRFPVTMRVAPTATVVAPTAFNVTTSNIGNATTTSLTMTVQSNRGCYWTAAVASGLAAGDATILEANATTSYIEFSADL